MVAQEAAAPAFELCISSPVCPHAAASTCRPNGSYPLPEEEPSAGSWWQCLWGGASVGSCGKGGKPTVQLEIVRGETVSEARQAFAGWATLVTRWAGVGNGVCSCAW